MHLPVPHGRSSRAHLIDDFRCRQVAGQAGLTGGTEWARHPAACLAGDAQRRAIRVAHQNALEQRSVVRLPQGLAGITVVAGDVPDRGEQRREQGGAHLVPNGCGQIRHLVGVGLEPAVVLPSQLIRTERR